MPEVDIVEICETDGIFYGCEWIGIGRQEHVDLPDFVKYAREAARVVPDNLNFVMKLFKKRTPGENANGQESEELEITAGQNLNPA